ncbi:hypothetical protein LY76DRAFT_156911 [Colletotrichum caudatum]|nr:hypothetical protein LY76DRAFT_156911 [Colletotrichum caudatum]
MNPQTQRDTHTHTQRERESPQLDPVALYLIPSVNVGSYPPRIGSPRAAVVCARNDKTAENASQGKPGKPDEERTARPYICLSRPAPPSLPPGPTWEKRDGRNCLIEERTIERTAVYPTCGGGGRPFVDAEPCRLTGPRGQCDCAGRHLDYRAAAAAASLAMVGEEGDEGRFDYVCVCVCVCV